MTRRTILMGILLQQQRFKSGGQKGSRPATDTKMSQLRASLPFMGYRRLLKRYMAHVDTLLGTPLVSGAAASEVFTKRDIGELNAMAAELSREALRDGENNRQESQDSERVPKPAVHYGELLLLTMTELDLTSTEVAEITDTPDSTVRRWCDGELEVELQRSELSSAEFTRILASLITATAKRRGAEPAAKAVYEAVSEANAEK